MQEQRKIRLRMKTAVYWTKGHPFPRLSFPRDIIRELGLTCDDKAVFITLYEDKTITIEKAEEARQ